MLYRLPVERVTVAFKSALVQEVGPVELTIPEARFRWGGWRHPIGIRLTQVSIKQKEISLQIPDLTISLKIWPLLKGRAEVGQYIFDSAKVYYEAYILGVVSGKVSHRAHNIHANVSFSDLNATGLIHLGMKYPFPVDSSLPLKGSLSLDVSQKDGLEHLNLSCESHGGHLVIPEIYPSPVVLDRTQVWLVGNKNSLTLKKASLKRGHATLITDGQAHTTDSWKTVYEKGGQVHLSIKGQGAAIPFDDLSLLWPQGLSPKPRDWVTHRLSRGTADHATAQMDGVMDVLAGGKIAAFKVPQIQGDIEARGVTVDYFGKLPPVIDTRGKCHFTRQQFFIDVVGIANGIQLKKGKIVISDLDAKDQTIDIQLDLEGPVRNSLEIVDAAPLHLARKLDLKPERISGSAKTQLHLAFPLESDLPLAEINVFAHSDIVEGKMVYEARLKGKPVQLDRGTFSLDVSKQSLDMKGTGYLQDVKTQIRWQEYFENNKIPFRRQFHIQGILGLEKLTNFGVEAHDYLAGRVPVVLKYTVDPSSEGILQGTVDLTSATMVSPILYWQKETGQPAELKVNIRKDPDQNGFDLSEFSLTAPQLTMVMGGKAGRLEVSRLDMGQSRLNALIHYDHHGNVNAQVGGKILDLSHVLDDSMPEPLIKPTKGQNDESKQRIKVKLNLDKVLLGKNNAIQQVNGEMAYKGDVLVSSQLWGKALHNEEPMALNMTPLAPSQQQFTLESWDGGHLLAMLGAGYDIEGGKLVIKGVKTERLVKGEKSWEIKGDINIEDFTLTKAPLLAKLLAAASLQGIINFFSGKGVNFYEGTADFSLTPERLSLDKVRLVSPTLGLFLNGYIDRKRHQVDFTGELSPLYVANMLLANIPLVGNWMSGGRDEEGVFLTHFTLRGNRQDPILTINPITTVTPGLMHPLPAKKLP